MLSSRELAELDEFDRAALECVQEYEGTPLVIKAPYPVRHSSGRVYARTDTKKVHGGRRLWEKNMPK